MDVNKGETHIREEARMWREKAMAANKRIADLEAEVSHWKYVAADFETSYLAALQEGYGS